MNLIDMLDRRLIRPDGRSTTLAARLDPRCSYCFYTPSSAWDPKLQNLLVYVHGSGRRFQFLLNALKTLAQSCRYLVLCPLFPANILRDGNANGYKYLLEGNIRYDEVLIDMVEEVRAAFRFEESHFLLGGFSGGAQFAHRFAYIHADMLKAVSIAAPGFVTLLDQNVPWWAGIGSMSSVFGREADLEGLRKVNIQLIVGGSDNRGEDASHNSANHASPHERNLSGTTRVEKLNLLRKSFEANGIESRLDIVPAVGHNFVALLPRITEFLSTR